MRRLLTIVVIVFVSGLIAFLISPPDPFSELYDLAAILLIAIPSYFVGLHDYGISIQVTRSDRTNNIPPPPNNPV